MNLRPNSRIPAYSSQARNGDKPLTWVRLAEAAELIGSKKAREIKGGAIQFIDIQRAQSQSPSGITESEMIANAAGNRTAQRKVRLWGQLQAENLSRLVVQA